MATHDSPFFSSKVDQTVDKFSNIVYNAATLGNDELVTTTDRTLNFVYNDTLIVRTARLTQENDGRLTLQSDTTGGGEVSFGDLAPTSSTLNGVKLLNSYVDEVPGTDVFEARCDGQRLIYFDQSGVGSYGNIRLGYSALNSALTGYGNVAIASYALSAITTGLYNIAIGPEALMLNQTGDYNCATGTDSLHYNLTGVGNCGYGVNTLVNLEAPVGLTPGSYNAAFGAYAGSTLTGGDGNTFFGAGADVTAAGICTERIGLGRNAKVSLDYSVQLGEDTAPLGGLTGICKYRSQILSKQAWVDGNSKYATIDANGNFVKSAISPAILGSASLIERVHQAVDASLHEPATVTLTVAPPSPGALQTAINALVDGDILEIQVSDAYTPITLPAGKSFSIRVLSDCVVTISPVVGQSAITIADGAGSIVVNDLVIDGALGDGAHGRGSGVRIADQGRATDVYFHNITFHNCATSPVDVSYWQDAAYANPYAFPANFSTRICFYKCHFAHAKSQNIEDAMLLMRGIQFAYIGDCDLDMQSASGDSPAESRGIMLQRSIDYYIEKNRVMNGRTGNGEGIKINGLAVGAYDNTGYIVDNYVKNCVQGIDCDDQASAVVADNVVYDCGTHGIVSTKPSSNLILLSNSVCNCATGFGLAGAGAFVAYGNRSFNNSTVNYDVAVNSSNTINIEDTWANTTNELHLDFIHEHTASAGTYVNNVLINDAYIDETPTTGIFDMRCDAARVVYIDQVNLAGVIYNNIGLGTSVFTALTTGTANVAIGDYNLKLLAGGQGNVAMGDRVLENITSGVANIGIGTKAGRALTGGSGDNIMMGGGAMENCTSASVNIAIGPNAMLNGYAAGQDSNIGIGASSLDAGVGIGGQKNVAVGRNTLRDATGSYNAVFGHEAGYGIGAGQYNLIMGGNACNSITIGDYNVYLGWDANPSAAGATTRRIGIGAEAEVSTDWWVQIGRPTASVPGTAQAKFYSQKFMDEAWIDAVVGIAKIDGTGNFVKGTDVISAGTDNHIVRWNGTTGFQDSAISIDDTTAMMNFLPTTGLLDIQCDSNHEIYMSQGIVPDAGSIRIGDHAMGNVAYAADGFLSVAIGTYALENCAQAENIAIGYIALRLNTEGFNTAVGVGAANKNVVGSHITAFGQASLSESLGSYCTGLGEGAGASIQNGDSNTCVGHASGRSSLGDVTGTSILGDSAKSNFDYGVSLGYQAITTGAYYVQIGQSGLASNSAKGYFYSQLWMDEAWRDGNYMVMANDATGNMVKTTMTTDVAGNLTVPGKLTVTGLIDPTGLELGPVAANPGGVAANTVWLDSMAANIMKKGALPIVLGPASSTDNAICRFDLATGGVIQSSAVTIDDTTAMMNFLPTTGFLDIQCDSGRGVYIHNTPDGSLGIGQAALAGYTYGVAESCFNIAIGPGALTLLPVGGGGNAGNIAIGKDALAAATTPCNGNLAIGPAALYNMTGGQYCVALGSGALQALVANSYNTAVGADVLPASTGSYNTGAGYSSFSTLGVGNSNVGLGVTSGYNITSGDGNLCLGYGSGKTAVGALSHAICLGHAAQVAANYYVQIGQSGLPSHGAKGYFYSQLWMDEAWRDGVVGIAKIDGTGNFVKGTDAISAGTDNHIVRWNGTTGFQDSAITIADTTAVMDFLPTTGKMQLDCDSFRSAFIDNTAYNIALGKSALASATTAARCVAIGYKALTAATTADYCIAIGYEALKSLTVLNGQENVAIGLSSLQSLVTGKYDVALGNDSGSLATGDYNTFLGRATGPALVAGDGNLMAGYYAGASITSGGNNTCIGHSTGRSLPAGALSYAVCIGDNACTDTNYYVQIGKSGDASHSAKGYFYSQLWMDEAWRDGTVGIAKIDGTGNFVKGTDAISAGTDNHIVRWNGTTGFQDSAISIDDTTAMMNFLPTTTLLDIQCDSLHAIYMCSNAGGSIRIGYDALHTLPYAVESRDSIAIGTNSLHDAAGGAIYNTAVGATSGQFSTGDNNSYFGYHSGYNINSGDRNVCIGVSTGRPSLGALTRAICLGDYAQVSTDYYVQIGQPGLASNSAKGYFYSQLWMDEAWRAGYTFSAVMMNDTTGNMVKSDYRITDGTHTTTWSGPWASAQACNVYWSREGRNITLTMEKGFSAAYNSSTAITMDTVLPAELRPIATGSLDESIFVTNNGSIVPGRAVINSSTGAITIYQSVGSTFTGPGNVGFNKWGKSYVANVQY